jgi:hypothetical protein
MQTIAEMKARLRVMRRLHGLCIDNTLRSKIADECWSLWCEIESLEGAHRMP